MGLYSRTVESYAPNSIMPDEANAEQRAILERYEANVGQFGNNTAEIMDIISLLYKTQLIEDTLAEVRQIDQKMQDYMKLIDDYYPRLEEIIDKLGVLDNIMEVYEDIVNVQKPYIDAQVVLIKNMSDELKREMETLENQMATFRKEVNETLALIKSYALASAYSFWEEDASNFIVLDPTKGSVSHHVLMEPLTSVSFATFKTEPTVARQLTVILEQGTGANKISKWDEKIKWSQDRIPVLSLESGRKDVVTLLTYDEGKSWLGFFNGGWFK